MVYLAGWRGGLQGRGEGEGREIQPPLYSFFLNFGFIFRFAFLFLSLIGFVDIMNFCSQMLYKLSAFSARFYFSLALYISFRSGCLVLHYGLSLHNLVLTLDLYYQSNFHLYYSMICSGLDLHFYFLLALKVISSPIYFCCQCFFFFLHYLSG